MALQNQSASALTQRFAQMCALAVTFSAALTMSEYLFDWNPGIDLWLFRESLAAVQAPIPGRPAILAADSFVLVGLALLLLNGKARHVRRIVESLSVTALLISLLALAGYACNVPSFYGWRSLYPNTGMALLTSESRSPRCAGTEAPQTGLDQFAFQRDQIHQTSGTRRNQNRQSR